MVKREILFNDEVYSIEESVIEASLAEMKSRLVDDYSGSGTILVYDGTTINVDSAKLAAAASNLAAMLNRFAGSGANIVVNGVTYGIDSAKLNSASTKLHVTLSDLQSGSGGGSDEPTDAELNEYGFYYDMPYSAEIEQGITYHVVLKESGVGELYATVAAELAAELFGASEAMEGVPASILMGAEMSPSWTLLEDGTLLFDMAGDGSQQMPFVVADNGLALTVIDGGEPMFNFVCTFEEYSDIYFEQTYYSCTAEFPDFIFKADGSAIAGGQVYPAGTLTYGPHKISLGGDSVLVSMNGKDLYLGGTKIGSMTPPCIHEYQEIGCECLTNSTHERITICTKCGAQFTTEEEHIDSNGDDICDKCGWDANTRAIAGLYETGSTKLIASWHKLLKDDDIRVENDVVTYGVRALQGDLVIPDSVTSIGDQAFYCCDKLTSVDIGNGVTSLGSRIFEDCSSLTSITMGNGITAIPMSAFENCTNLTSINIPDSITVIDSRAFYGCSSLTSITIPDSVTSIDAGAFKNCSSLTSVTIPDSVTDIGNYAFDGCSGLTEINFNATAMNEPSSSNFIFIRSGTNGSGITVNIGANVTRIPAYLFMNEKSYAHNITSVIFEEGSVCTSIGDYAFKNCSSLTSITIPESVMSLGEEAFDGCSGLTEINFNATAVIEPNSDNDSHVFRNAGINGSGTTVNIGANVTCIPNFLFNSASQESLANNITSVVFEEGSVCTSIGQQAFGFCKVTSITIPDSVTSIGIAAFTYCTRLNEVTIGKSVTNIGNSAFYSCRYLNSLKFTGTTTQWNAITKGNDWNMGIGVTYVQCSDGRVTFERYL